MKKSLVVFSALMAATSLWAQAPQKMSFQAVVRNSSGMLVKNTVVGMRISLLNDSASGAAVFVETHTPTTNANGLATIEIGGGTPSTGAFYAVDWGLGPYFITTETDPLGGTNYSISGTQQLLSVPYALYAEKTATPGYPAYQSDESTTFSAQTVRNTWVDDPQISVIVPETGKYLLTFYGSAYNGNVYFGTETDYDSDGEVRVFNTTAASELYKVSSLVQYNDLYSPSLAQRKYMPMRPARSFLVNLTANDELRIQYKQNVFGTLATTWYIGASGITIMKVGN